MERILREVEAFLKREDVSYSYREEEDYAFKMSEGPSAVVRVKEAVAPDGRRVRVVITETFYDDTSVSYQEVVAEVYQSWREPRRIFAVMYTGENGMPVYTNRQLFNDINRLFRMMPGD